MEAMLGEITRSLNRGSLNYTVSVGLWRLPGCGDLSVAEVLGRVLRHPVTLGNSWPVTAEQVVDEVLASLQYRGDAGSHPNLKALGGTGVRLQVTNLGHQLGEICGAAELSVGFWLKEGHPYYPVFWDFAFFFSVDGDALVLIGSASD